MNAMAFMLEVVSDPASVQAVNDRTLPDATAVHEAGNPGNAIGRQARYYAALEARLGADGRSGTAAPAVQAKPFKPS